MAIALLVPVVVIEVVGGSHASAPQARPPQAEPSLARAGLQVSPLPGWKASAAVPAIPGLRFGDPISLQEQASGMRLVAGLLPTLSPTMLPPELLLRLQASLSRPTVVELERGLQAHYYPGLSVAGLAAPLDVYVLPTTAGIVTAACVAGDEEGARYYECWKNVATLRLLAGRALGTGRDAALRQRLVAEIATIEATRRGARPELAGRIPAAQARAAARVATAYERAASSLRLVAHQSSGWARAIVAQVEAVGAAYRRVVGPLRSADAAAYARGRAIVHERERRLERLIRDRAAR